MKKSKTGVKKMMFSFTQQTQRILRLTLGLLLLSAVGMNAAGLEELKPDVHLNQETQQKTITGKVTDQDGLPLPGVSVVVKGTTTGTITGGDGAFELAVPSSNEILVFSFIGMKSQEVNVAGKTILSVVMSDAAIGLEEVVAVGYGYQKKSDLTSAIATISADAIEEAPVADWGTAIQGMSPGVEVQGNQGRPGSKGTIRIRGVGSINSTDPLVVVDGVPMGGDAVSPADIKSVEILKDAASCAIYGSRGANGVILITTKKGSKGAPKFSLNSYYGVEEAWKQLDLMNSTQWADLVYDVNTNAGKGVPEKATWIRDNDSQYDGTESDWQDAMFQTGVIQEHNLSISGGNESGNYYISTGYFNQEGIMLATDYERMNIRVNSTWKKGKFTFGENIGFQYSTNSNEIAEGGATNIEHMLKETGPVKIYDETRLGGFGGPESADGHDGNNPVAVANRIDDRVYTRLFNGAIYGELEILPGLKYKLNLGVESKDRNVRTWKLATDVGPKGWSKNELQESHNWDYQWAIENTLTWQKKIGEHDFTALAGYTSEYSKMHSMVAMGKDIDSETLHVLGLVETEPGVAGVESELAMASILGRALYSYKGKYLLTANIRRDGVSKFNEENRYGVFPSVSAGWRISEEDFASNMKFLTNLKARGSYGTLGNQSPVGRYSIASSLVTGANYVFNNGINGSSVGVVPRVFANSDLQWETVKQLDIGFDATIFENFDLVFDYYKKETENMLVQVPIPLASGSKTPVSMNAGSVRNTGIEFSATYRKDFNDLHLEFSGNVATVNNEVVSMGVEGGVINAGAVEFNKSGVTRTEVGHPIGSFYGYLADGIFLTDEEVTAHKAQPNAVPGDVRFKDLDGDDAITPEDRDYMGSPIPDLMYGARITADYKNFDFNVFFQGVSGNEIYSELMVWTQGMQNNFNATTDALDRFPYSTTSGIPRAVRDDPNGNVKKASTRYIKDGSYLRLKNLVFGYTLPKDIVSSIGVNYARIYFSGRNLLTFTKYNMYDPEIGSGALATQGTANTARGIDNGYYPQARAYTFGVQIDF